MKNKSGIKKTKKAAYKDGATSLNLLTRFKNWKYTLSNPAKLIVAHFELVTGDFEMHVVEVRHDNFTLFENRYLVNEEYLVYNRTLKMYVGFYHQACSLPIKPKVNVNLLIDNIEKYARDSDNPKVADVVNNIDPHILERFTTSTVIQNVFAGAEMQDLFGFLKLMSILILIGVGLCLTILVYMSGIFS